MNAAVSFSSRFHFLIPQVRHQSEVVWRDHICGAALRVTVLLWLVPTLALLWFYRHLPPELPLWYSRPWGEQQLAPAWMLFILPASAALLLLLNGLLAGNVFTREPLLARMMLVAVAVMTLLLSVSLTRILLLVL